MRARTFLALAGAVAAAAAGCRTHAGDVAAAPLTALRSVDVTYAGEAHDQLAHHAYELRMLQELTAAGQRDGTPVLLGMEMFQRPFQRHLDDYVAGRVPEREMLRRTGYFDRWSYDHTLYAPLWQHCREHGVRIVALNADRDVTRVVSRGGGLDALTPQQRAVLAAEIDLGVEAHRERVMAVFRSGAHPMPEEALQGYYAAMTAWDETMAESAAQALVEAGPGARMLVVAGSQHVQEFTGIPDRVSRRLPGTSRAVVVLRTLGSEEAGSPPDAALGDFVVRLAPVAAPPPTRLGVMLRDEPLPEGLLVTGLVAGGNGARAGLLVDDVVQWVGDARITDMTDLRYALDRTPLGTTLCVRVLRGWGRRCIEVTFEPPPDPSEKP